ncbi:MAG: 50S ribosomal protein L18e [Candidatus Hadarchaeum sp.]|uniref:50S ribosomal protein L18e n=1 Tax=Candidatus Hadarchaeum sp. TaxID=2883567 RepID=UPI00316E7373
MPKPTGPTNPQVRKLLRLLREQGKKQKAKIWLDLAERLERPRRSRAEVNLSQINRYTENGSFVAVPGKVLSAGRLDHPVKVAALAFSAPAKRKILAAGGTPMTLQQLLEQNPVGKGVKLME